MNERYSLTFSDALHACVPVFTHERFPTMSRACVDVSRACVRAWTSYYDAACVLDRFAFVFTYMRAYVLAYVDVSRSCVTFLLSSSRTCVLAYVDVSCACVDVFVHTSCELFRFCIRSGPGMSSQLTQRRFRNVVWTFRKCFGNVTILCYCYVILSILFRRYHNVPKLR